MPERWCVEEAVGCCWLCEGQQQQQQQQQQH